MGILLLPWSSVSKSYEAADSRATHRLRQWLRRKHKVSGAGIKRYPDVYLYENLGLLQLASRTRNLPWAKA